MTEQTRAPAPAVTPVPAGNVNILGFSLTGFGEPRSFGALLQEHLAARGWSGQVREISYGGLSINALSGLTTIASRPMQPGDVVFLEIATSFYSQQKHTLEDARPFVFAIAGHYAQLAEHHVAFLNLFRADLDDNDCVVQAIREASEHFGIPIIDLKTPFRAMFPTEPWGTTDGVHPDEGSRERIAAELLRYLDTAPLQTVQARTWEGPRYELIPAEAFAADLERFQYAGRGKAMGAGVLGAGRSVTVTLDPPRHLEGVYFLYGPETGYLDASVDGGPDEELVTFDEHCYYRRVGFRPLQGPCQMLRLTAPERRRPVALKRATALKVGPRSEFLCGLLVRQGALAGHAAQASTGGASQVAAPAVRPAATPADTPRIDALIAQRSHRPLLAAADALESAFPAFADHGDRRRAYSALLRAHTVTGRFDRACELAARHVDGYRFAFHHPNCQHYVRSALARFFADGVAPKAPTEALDGRLTAMVISAVIHHFAGRTELRQTRVERAFAAIRSFEDAVALVNLLHYYSVPVDGPVIRQALSRLPAPTQAAHAALAEPGTAMAPPAVDGMRYVFVGGAARSGTTATGGLLNLAPSVSLFTELYSPYLGYTASMFGHEALHTPYFERKYHFVRDVHHRARIGPHTRYLGDKRPLFLNSWNITQAHFRPDDIRIITLIREPAEILQSYDKRAERGSRLADSWNADRTRLLAESDLVLQAQRLDEIAASPYAASMKLVPYPDVLTDRDTAFGLFDFLGVTRDAALTDAVLAMLDDNAEYMEKHSPGRDAVAEYRFLDESTRARYAELLAAARG